MQLELTQIHKNITFKIKSNARYSTIYNNDQDAYRRGENIRFDLPEAYINYEAYPGSFLKQFNLVLGLQTISWGKADEIRPTDILSPQDMTLFVLEGRNERKLGRFAARSQFNFGEAFRMEAIWMPMQRSTEMTMDDKSLFTPAMLLKMKDAGFTVNSVEMPEQKLAHSDVALKGYSRLLGADFSLSFYNGYDPMPFSKVDMGSTSITPILNRVTMWGFDFEKVVGSFVVRGEAAYFAKGYLFSIDPNTHGALFAKYGSDALAEKEMIDATLGIDKNDFLVQKMYLNLQYSMQYILDFEKGLRNRMGSELKETNHMLIWDWYYEWDNLTYRVEFAGNYSFTQEAYLLNPSFHVKLGLETKAILGAYIFGGERESDMGQYQDKTFAYLQLEHLF